MTVPVPVKAASCSASVKLRDWLPCTEYAQPVPELPAKSVVLSYLASVTVWLTSDRLNACSPLAAARRPAIQSLRKPAHGNRSSKVVRVVRGGAGWCGWCAGSVDVQKYLRYI